MLLPHLDSTPEDPVELGTIRLRYLALSLRSGQGARSAGLQAQGNALARSLARLKPVDPGFWMALAQFHEASENPTAAAQERARGRALNPRVLVY
jgi:hypothetical protein